MKVLYLPPAIVCSGKAMTRQRNVTQTIRFIAVLPFLMVFALVVIPPATADSPPPVTTLTAYFEQNAVPVNDSVNFTVNCTAYSCRSGACEQGEPVDAFGDVYTFSALCPSYGCFMTEYGFEDYDSLTSCDITGELNGETFVIPNATYPFTCTPIDRGSRSCDLRVNLSSAITHPGISAMITNPPPRSPVEVMEPAPIVAQGPKNLLDDIWCFITTVLGGTC
jgi:hypothetical protein